MPMWSLLREHDRARAAGRHRRRRARPAPPDLGDVLVAYRTITKRIDRRLTDGGILPRRRTPWTWDDVRDQVKTLEARTLPELGTDCHQTEDYRRGYPDPVPLLRVRGRRGRHRAAALGSGEVDDGALATVRGEGPSAPSRSTTTWDWMARGPRRLASGAAVDPDCWTVRGTPVPLWTVGLRAPSWITCALGSRNPPAGQLSCVTGWSPLTWRRRAAVW